MERHWVLRWLCLLPPFCSFPRFQSGSSGTRWAGTSRPAPATPPPSLPCSSHIFTLQVCLSKKNELLHERANFFPSKSWTDCKSRTFIFITLWKTSEPVLCVFSSFFNDVLYQSMSVAQCSTHATIILPPLWKNNPTWVTKLPSVNCLQGLLERLDRSVTNLRIFFISKRVDLNLLEL